jgi:protein-L-isoaspartate O-methyltransferase
MPSTDDDARLPLGVTYVERFEILGVPCVRVQFTDGSHESMPAAHYDAILRHARGALAPADISKLRAAVKALQELEPPDASS